MANQYTNKVILGNETLIDLTNDTVTAADVASGVTFHLPNGQPSVGTASGGEPGGIIIRDTTDSHGGTIRELIASDLYSISSFSLSSNGTFYAPSGILWDEVIADVPSGISPSGTKSISILQNGTTTEDVSAFAYAQIITNVPNSYSAADEGKVVSGAALVAQTASTVTANATYDTTLINSLTVSVSGGGGDSKENEIIERTISGTYVNSDVTTIGLYAFAMCSLLTSINFPNATVIGSSAFNTCSNIATAVFPEVLSINGYAFQSCWALVSDYSFPKATYIGAYAFGFCSYLTELNFPNVTIVDANAFAYCHRVSSIDMPSLRYTFAGAFINLSALEYVSLPELLYLQGTSLFASCSNLLSVDLPKATGIPNGTFSACNKLMSVNIPRASFVSNGAFYSCYSLQSITLPKVSTVGSSAFYYNYSLSTVILNYDVKSANSIYQYAFGRCYNLLSLYLIGSSVFALNNTNAFMSTPISTYTTSTGGVQGSIFVKESLYSTYSTATNWATYAARFVSLTESQVSHVIEYGTHVM